MGRQDRFSGSPLLLAAFVSTNGKYRPLYRLFWMGSFSRFIASYLRMAVLQYAIYKIADRWTNRLAVYPACSYYSTLDGEKGCKTVGQCEFFGFSRLHRPPAGSTGMAGFGASVRRITERPFPLPAKHPSRAEGSVSSRPLSCPSWGAGGWIMHVYPSPLMASLYKLRFVPLAFMRFPLSPFGYPDKSTGACPPRKRKAPPY